MILHIQAENLLQQPTAGIAGPADSSETSSSQGNHDYIFLQLALEPFGPTVHLLHIPYTHVMPCYMDCLLMPLELQ